ncbi:unnamed protein product [Kluyveromyces dobzhanskii CBS 2104]|uniref:WGS project CCBQ000000000 data, contig 00102 n=1 Tax=Kluyveromyces dobzhanskii CBS 2104 TaxID=1427455 RepID=A0A0A8L774_9SACH|nr:unnamed protein product [Kluyveromyces dobzhanskii CBS 2104]
MSLVSAAYYSDSEEGDSESDRELIEDKVQNHISSLPDLPDKIINRFNKPPVLDHLNDRMYRSPVSKTTCFMFFQVRLDSKQYQLLDIVLNDVNSVMNAYKLKNFEPLHRGKLGTIKPLHVSLTSSLNFANRADLNASIAQIKKDIAALKVKSIPISLSGNWCLYENFDASLSFLTLNLAQPSRRQLEPVLDAIKKTYRQLSARRL